MSQYWSSLGFVFWASKIILARLLTRKSRMPISKRWGWELFFSINATQFQATLSTGCGRKSASVFLHLNAHEDLTRVSSMMPPVEISVLNAQCKSPMLLIYPLLSLLKHRIRCYDYAVSATSTGMFTNSLTSLSKCLGTMKIWKVLEFPMDQTTHSGVGTG